MTVFDYSCMTDGLKTRGSNGLEWNIFLGFCCTSCVFIDSYDITLHFLHPFTIRQRWISSTKISAPEIHFFKQYFIEENAAVCCKRIEK